MIALFGAVPHVFAQSHSLTHILISPHVSTNAPWAFQNQNQQNTGYSPQNIVNASNVANLKLLWSDSLARMAGTPVISGGIVYVDGANDMIAVNEATGSIVWKDGPGAQTGLSIHTAVGVTIDNGNIYAGTVDNQLVSLNAKTGALNFAVSIINGVVGSFANYTGAQATPLAYNGRIIIGETLGNNGVRGLVRAFNETNGNLLWTFYTTPPAPINATNQSFYLNTWGTNGTFGCLCGGGTLWSVPAVDPATGIIYFGTGSPHPGGNIKNFDARSPNPSYTNLYSNSVLALNSTTGQMIWYYQVDPADPRDADEGMPVQLFTTTINGVPTEVVGSGGKSGYYTVLNAKTGALVWQVGVGIHFNEDAPPGTGLLIYPGSGGGVNTFSAFNPSTNEVFTTADNSPDGPCNPCPPQNSTLYALNASTGATLWSLNMVGLGSGTTTTNSLVFMENAHYFYALDALTGTVIWKQFDSSGGNPPTWFSWGAPSITDGLVFETTLGSATTGLLEAFTLQQPTSGGVTVSITLNSDTTSNSISSSNSFMLTYTISGAITHAKLTGGTQTFQVDASTAMSITGKASGSNTAERWCFTKTCSTLSLNSGPTGSSFTFVYYDAVHQSVSDSILGGGTPAVKLTYFSAPSAAGATDSPTSTTTKLSTTVKTIWAVRATAASVPSIVTVSTIKGEQWVARVATSWTISAPNVITNPVAYQNQYAVTISSSSAQGSTIPAGTAFYDAGSSISVMAIGSSFSSWTPSNSLIVIANTKLASTTATINGSGTIVANF